MAAWTNEDDLVWALRVTNGWPTDVRAQQILMWKRLSDQYLASPRATKRHRPTGHFTNLLRQETPTT